MLSLSDFPPPPLRHRAWGRLCSCPSGLCVAVVIFLSVTVSLDWEVILVDMRHLGSSQDSSGQQVNVDDQFSM